MGRKKKTIGVFSGGTKSRKQFKSEQAYLEYIFEQNQERIVSSYRKDKPSISIAESRRKFIAKIKAIRREDGYGTRKAIELASRMRTFTTAAEMGLINIKNHLSRENFNRIKFLVSKVNNSPYRTTAVNWNEFIWNEARDSYVHLSQSFEIGWTHSGNSLDEDWIFIKEI